MDMEATPKTHKTAILPDGSTVTRRTHKPYTHVVALRSDGVWNAVSWHTSHPLALKRSAIERPYGEVQIVEVAS